MFNKALKYLTNKRPEKAVPLFMKLLKDGAEYKEIYLNLGSCYKMLDRDDDAIEMYLKAADPLVPFTNNSFVDEYPEALNNLGLMAGTYQEDDISLMYYRRAIAANPKYYDAYWNMANTLLRKYSSNKYDNLKLCWELYENRFKRTLAPVTLKSRAPVLHWDGSHVDTLCILAEQGMGDQLMWGRYLALAATRCNKLYVQCNESMKVFFSSYNTCSDPSEIPGTVYGIGMCSLGRIFNQGLPDGEWLSDRNISKIPNGKLDIGVTWSGNPNHANDRHRSTESSRFRTLAKFGTLYTLNPTEAGRVGFVDLASSCWSDSITALSHVDLVICVDTSIAHLCGSMGKPCWLLNMRKDPDWRWGDDSMGYDNVWYPSVRVFRNPGNWDIVFNNVEIELEKLSNSLRTV